MEGDGIASQLRHAHFSSAVSVELEAMNPRPLGVDAEQHHWSTKPEGAMHTRSRTDSGAVSRALAARPCEGQAVLPHEPPEPRVDLCQLCRMLGDRIRTHFVRVPSGCVTRLAMHRPGCQDTQAGCEQC